MIKYILNEYKMYYNKTFEIIFSVTSFTAYNQF